MTNAPLVDVQRDAGAVWAEGEPVARSFGDPTAEYVAARDAAAVFDVSDRAQVELTGRDRAKFLHNFCTNDVKALRPGEGCEAFVPNVKGKLLGHVFVFAGADALWVESVAGSSEFLVSHLDRYLISEDVRIRDRTADWGELYLSGAEAAGHLGRLGVAAETLARNGHVSGELSGTAVSVRRVDWLAVPGFLVAAPRERLAELWTALTAAGVRPAGADASNALRIEAGLPLYGVDMTDENLAQEAARTPRAISFTKGCYLGQEPIARIDALGHVNRELRGLRLASVPRRGDVVTANGQQVGAVTSAAVVPATGESVALAYVRRSAAKPGAEVGVLVGGREVPARVYWPAELLESPPPKAR